MRAVRAQEQLDLNTESLALVNNLWIFPHSLMTKYSVINKNLHNISAPTVLIAFASFAAACIAISIAAAAAACFDIVVNSINRIMDAMEIHHHIFFLMRVSHHQKISLTG